MVTRLIRAVKAAWRSWRSAYDVEAQAAYIIERLKEREKRIFEIQGSLTTIMGQIQAFSEFMRLNEQMKKLGWFIRHNYDGEIRGGMHKGFDLDIDVAIHYMMKERREAGLEVVVPDIRDQLSGAGPLGGGE